MLDHKNVLFEMFIACCVLADQSKARVGTTIEW